MLEKRPLGVEELEAQTALELPDREMLALVNVTLGNLAVQVPVGVAANVCDINAAVLVAAIHDEGSATCEADADSRADAKQIARIFNL
jgi:hypothetical protein